ncbi:hypothetical protein [Anabaena subtropica]|uniref:Uncharacterized protein n=1 Tax=Anabaena subtropica FACHB-260 TaxID=2692884 RepID=A0ABR8CMX8_9NOST|nr:hypothetical protein [Anabaena subtropica]MBD2344379.1 hypothetical protein [Anabaena subtropica FACHB-260]
MINQLIKAFQPKDANITVSVGFDNKYLDYGKILLRSINKNSPNVKVVVLAINTHEDSLNEFSELKNFKIIHEKKEFAHEYEQRLYTIARRIFLVNELRQDSSIENLLQLDADAIVKRDLNRFGNLFKQGDFCIFARPQMKYEFLRLTMNVLGLNNSPASKALTKEWIAQLWQMLAEPQDTKYIDQLTLWKAYEKINQEYGIKLVNLQPPFIGNSRNTIIRTFYATKDAKGDQKLVKELNKFTDKPLEDAPSNAPPKPEGTDVFLTKNLLRDNFEKAGFI